VSSLTELGLREAQWKAQLDAAQEYQARVKAGYEQARAAVQAALDGDEGRGVKSFGALLPDGRAVASVTLTDPDPAPVVTDLDAFLGWVRDTYPTEYQVREVHEANTAWQTALFKAMKKLGKAVDPATGEIVPGVEVPTERKRSHRLTFADDGQALIDAAQREGLVPHPALLAEDNAQPQDDAV
jgi:hypothetical protein